MDIEAAYVFASITSIENGFGNVADHEDISDLETPTECKDEDVSELKANCACKASLLKKHEDHDDDVEPPMSVQINIQQVMRKLLSKLLGF